MRGSRRVRSTSSTRASEDALSSRSSGTASMTRAHSEKLCASVETCTSRPSACMPRSMLLASACSTRALAAAAASSSRSTIVTRAPASRNACAMPAPMRPPPRTPTAVVHRLAPSVEECAHPLALVVGFEQHRLLFEIDLRMRAAGREVRSLGRLGRLCAELRDAVGHLVRAGHRLVAVVVEVGDEPGRKRLVCVQDAAGQQHLGGDRFAHDLAQPPGRAGCGDDAEPGLGIAELGGRRADADVCCIRELCAAAERVSVDDCDDRHRQLANSHECAGVDALECLCGTAVAKLRDVGAGCECAASSGEDQRARVAIRVARTGRAARRWSAGRSRCASRGG